MSRKILIVDDEKNIRTTLKHCLKEEGYEIDIAINGDEALQKIMEQQFNLILLDIKMPGLTGMEVLSEIRRRGNKVDIIMMTAYGTIDRAVEAMKLGAVDFISKPFTPDEIRNIVKEVLDRKNLQEEKLETFEEVIGYSKRCILDGSYSDAQEFLKRAISMNVDAPEPHNLLGVISEYRKKIDNAQTHYRAALALDPTYVPARNNLERTVEMRYTKVGMDLGDEKDGE